MADLFRSLCFLIALFTMPGALADIVVRLAQAMQFSILPLMAPERVPHAVAICVTQIWLTVLGVGLVAAAMHSWMHDRNTPHADGI